MGGFPHGTGARQGGRFPTAPAPGKVGGFPRHRRPARWADSTRTGARQGGRIPTAPAPGKVGGFPHSTGARQVGGFHTAPGARQQGRILHHRRPAKWHGFTRHRRPVGGFPQHRRPARWADPTQHRRPAKGRIPDTAPAPGKVDSHTAPAPGKVGGFPRHRRPARWADSHGTGARQGGGFPRHRARQGGGFHTAPAPGKVGFPQHRRPARWADFHTAPAPGKVGGFPHGTGARQGGRISNFNYTLCYLWIVQLSGALAVTVRCPQPVRAAAANSQYGAATRRRVAVPRAGARRFPRTPVEDVRQLRGGRLGYGLAGGLACCSGQSRSFRRFAAGVRWSPARSPSMP